jgi:hypothetical protein
MLQPIKNGFGAYMGRYYGSLTPTTKALHEFVDRGLKRSIVWAPARMVDAVEDMLNSWRRNENRDGVPSSTAMLPVMFVAMAKDYVPSGREFGRQASEQVSVTLPGDPEERHFKVRVIHGDIRTQIAIAAADEPTAKSLAAQFGLFVDNMENRRFLVPYEFEGIPAGDWPVLLESSEIVVSSVATEQKNITLLAVDITLKASIPLFQAPKLGEPSDGKPVYPQGYPVMDGDAAITGQLVGS